MIKRKLPPAISLWIMITAALLIFVGLSLGKDITIGNHTLTKARFPETLFAKDDLLIIPVDSISILDTIPDIEELILVEPDSTIHNVLVFGDSMTHHLAMSIAKYGTKNGYKVTGVTWESSSIPGWANSPKLDSFLNLSKPDFIFISLGSNETGLKNFDRRIPDIQKIINRIGDIPYIWVGPPLWKEDQGLYPAIRKVVPQDAFFSTGMMELQRGPDHIHPTRKGADVWADSLMRWIKYSYHPIRAEIPDSGTTTKGHRLIYLHPSD